MTMKAEIYKSDDGKEYEITDIPAEYQEVAEARREMMIDAIAETDDDIMMKYLEGEEISVEELKAALRKAVIANQLFPVLCGSSYKNKGVQNVIGCCYRLHASSNRYPTY